MGRERGAPRPNSTERTNVNDSDISLAMRVDDLSLIECVFHAEPLPQDPAPKSHLLVSCPSRQSSVDAEHRRNVLRTMVSVRFGLTDPSSEGGDEPRDLLQLGVVVGVVVTSPLMGEAAIAARHMAGSEEDAVSQRDRKMLHSMLLEAIKSGYAFASSKMVELSSMSAAGPVMLPLIDADEILIDIEKNDAE